MKNHNSKDCRVTKGRKCMKCGIMGHFAKCCKTQNPKKPENHQVRASKVTTESSSDDETSVFKIGSKERPVYPVYIDGTPINMLIDSGSTLNIIDETSFQKLPKEPQLESSKTKIFTYLGKEPLKLKGTFRAKAEAFGKETQAKFYVTKGSGGALLGQKTAEKLDILRVGPVLGSKADPTNSLHKSVNEISQEKPTEHKIDPKIQKVLDNNREVFEGMAFEQFQKVIEQSIAGCPGTRSISDDILIWSSSRDEMEERLDTLFKALHARNLKINPKKCVFGTTKLTFAGYCLTDKGIHPDKSKVDAVNNAKVPTNATEVRSFLDEFKQYLKQHGIKLRNVTPYSPWVNGEVERFNRSLKKANQCAHAEGKDWREELNKFLLLYRTTPHATTGQCPATVFFGRGIKNDIPEYAKDGSQDTELDRKDREKKGKMKNYTDIKRNAKDSEIQEQDTVLVKNLWKNDKLSPNWLNEKFKVIKIYRKSALLENERGNKFYRNKAHLKKYNESESNRQAVTQKKNTHNTDEEEDILAEELLIDNAQNVARPTRSERRPNRAITNANDANNTPHLNENNNSSLHESDNADMHQNSENRFKEGIVEDHWNKQSNEDIQEDIGNRTPVFVPDSVPTAIQEQVQVKKFPIRRSRKKKN
eukprot:gene4164-biopygen11942